MASNTPLLILELPCDQVVSWLQQRASQAGLSVEKTFDLQAARRAHELIPCPQHGMGVCDCQMVVLIFYQPGHQPLTMIVRGSSGQTWFTLVDTPQQRADPQLENELRRLLASQLEHGSISTSLMNLSDIPGYPGLDQGAQSVGGS